MAKHYAQRWAYVNTIVRFSFWHSLADQVALVSYLPRWRNAALMLRE